MAVGDIYEVAQRLQKDSIAMALYRNKEGKFLICKTPFFHQYTLPCTPIDDSQSVNYFLNPILEEEFNIVPIITDYIETTRGIYLKNNKLSLGNIICIKYTDYDNILNTVDKNIMDSVIYTEKQYVTYEEVLELYNNNQINSYSMYCIEREYQSEVEQQ